MSQRRKGRLSDDQFDEAVIAVFAVFIAIATIAGLMRCLSALF
jgi:hypothetical protein